MELAYIYRIYITGLQHQENEIENINKTDEVDASPLQGPPGAISFSDLYPDGMPDNQPRANPEYSETVEAQEAWMERCQNMALERFAGANRAVFKQTFYHRGFAYRQPASCGLMQAWRDEALVADFQGFICVGLRSVYFENEEKYFSIYWNQHCVQTTENPRG